MLTAIAFLTAFVYVLTTKNADDDESYYYNNGGDDPEDENTMDPEIAVTSRALAFSALWTAVLSGLMSVFGTVVLGFQSPFSGQYYLCCDRSVHRTTPLGLGSFISALLMLANLTLICSVLFGEFEVCDNWIEDAKDRYLYLVVYLYLYLYLYLLFKPRSTKHFSIQLDS